MSQVAMPITMITAPSTRKTGPSRTPNASSMTPNPRIGGEKLGCGTWMGWSSPLCDDIATQISAGIGACRNLALVSGDGSLAARPARAAGRIDQRRLLDPVRMRRGRARDRRRRAHVLGHQVPRPARPRGAADPRAEPARAHLDGGSDAHGHLVHGALLEPAQLH